MEYAMNEIPCVASKVYPYFKDIEELHTIQDGQTGLLAIDGLDFYHKLKFLVENPSVRLAIGKNAKQEILDNWQFKDNIHKLENILEEIGKIPMDGQAFKRELKLYDTSRLR